MRRIGKGALLGLAVAACLTGCTGKKGPEGNTATGTPPEVTQTSQKEDTVSYEGLAEAPQLEALVKAGKLWERAKRLPREADIYVAEGITGQYSESCALAASEAEPLTGWLFTEGLFSLDEKGEVVPNLAKSYTVNGDATVYTIYLREKLRWSDDVPFTADDCLFYYNSLYRAGMVEEAGSLRPYSSAGGNAVFAKVSDYCFTVTFPTSKPEFLKELVQTGGVCFAPEHYYVNLLPEYMGEAAALSKAKAMGYADAYEMIRGAVAHPQNFAGLPTLNAFVLSREDGKDDVKGAYYEFLRNPYYWKVDANGCQLPYFDRVEFTRTSGEKQLLLLTTEGYLSVGMVASQELAEVQASAEHGGYSVVSWADGQNYAVSSRLMNFPQTTPGNAAVRRIGAGHIEYWYLK